MPGMALGCPIPERAALPHGAGGVEQGPAQVRRMRREPALALSEEAREESARWGEEDRGERARAASGFWGETPSARATEGIRSAACAFCFYFFLVWVGVRYIFLFLASGVVGPTYFWRQTECRYTYF